MKWKETSKERINPKTKPMVTRTPSSAMRLQMIDKDADTTVIRQCLCSGNAWIDSQKGDREDDMTNK